MKKIILGLLLSSTVALAEAKDDRKNTFSILGGYGADNKVDVVPNGATSTVKASSGVLAGFLYQRTIADEVVLGGAVLINGTVLGSVGLRF